MIISKEKGLPGIFKSKRSISLSSINAHQHYHTFNRKSSDTCIIDMELFKSSKVTYSQNHLSQKSLLEDNDRINLATWLHAHDWNKKTSNKIITKKGTNDTPESISVYLYNMTSQADETPELYSKKFSKLKIMPKTLNTYPIGANKFSNISIENIDGKLRRIIKEADSPRKSRESQRVSIQDSNDIRYIPSESLKKAYVHPLQQSNIMSNSIKTASEARLFYENDLESPSLFIDPASFGCTLGCTGMKSDVSSTTTNEVLMKNISTIPLLSQNNVFYDDMLPTKYKRNGACKVCEPCLNSTLQYDIDARKQCNLMAEVHENGYCSKQPIPVSDAYGAYSNDTDTGKFRCYDIRAQMGYNCDMGANKKYNYDGINEQKHYTCEIGAQKKFVNGIYTPKNYRYCADAHKDFQYYDTKGYSYHGMPTNTQAHFCECSFKNTERTQNLCNCRRCQQDYNTNALYENLLEEERRQKMCKCVKCKYGKPKGTMATNEENVKEKQIYSEANEIENQDGKDALEQDLNQNKPEEQITCKIPNSTDAQIPCQTAVYNTKSPMRNFSCYGKCKSDEDELIFKDMNILEDMRFAGYYTCDFELDGHRKPEKHNKDIKNIINNVNNRDICFCEAENMEKEVLLKTVTALPLTQSVAVETIKGKACYENIDLGRNITIQVVPNDINSSNENNEKQFETSRQLCYEDTSNKMLRIRIANPSEHNTNKFPVGNYCQCTKNVLPSNYAESNYPPHVHEQYCKPCGVKRKQSKWCCWKRKKPDTNRNYNFPVGNGCRSSMDPNHQGFECQRVMPISQEYQRTMTIRQTCPDENTTCNIKNMNKHVLRGLFATPCPSWHRPDITSAFGSVQYPPGANNYYIPSICPLKTNQSSQCESCQKTEPKEESKQNKSGIDPNQVLAECFKCLTEKISLNDRCPCDESDPSCYRCQSYNTYCCCCRNMPICSCCCLCTKGVKTKNKSRKTTCRCVEAKQSCKDVGTKVSTSCMKMCDTIGTNTDILKSKKRVHCCRPRCHCCTCCPHLNNCCCCRGAHSKEIGEASESEDDPHKVQHLTFTCLCKHITPFKVGNIQIPTLQNEKMSIKETLKITNEQTDVTTNTKNLCTSQYQSVKTCQLANYKSEVKSTNIAEKDDTTAKNELIVSVTQNLCNLGDKTFAKFGLPSQRYHWSCTNFENMPNELKQRSTEETYQNILTGYMHDPTPCLKPEVLNMNCNKTPLKNSDVYKIDKLPDAAGDIKESTKKTKRYLSAICEAIFASKESLRSNKYPTRVGIELVPNVKYNFTSDTTFQKDNKSTISINDCSKSETIPLVQKTSTKKVPEILIGENLESHEDNSKVEHQEDVNCSVDQVLSTKIKKTKEITRNSLERTKKIEQKDKTKQKPTLCRTSTIYDPVRPFTTKTGLMSFIPSLRENSKCSLKNKNEKSRNSTVTMKKLDFTKHKKLESKPKLEDKTDIKLPKLQTKPPSACKNEQTDLDMGKKSETNISFSKTEKNLFEIVSRDHEVAELCRSKILDRKISVTNLEQLSETLERENKSSQTTFIEENSKKKTLDSSTSDHNFLKSNSNFKKFDNEIYCFCKKCVEPTNDLIQQNEIPYMKKTVSDIVKSLETSSLTSFSCRSFVGSLLGSQFNCIDAHNDYVLKDFLFDNNDGSNGSVFDFSLSGNRNKNADFRDKVFQGSSQQNEIQIPDKILSKTDLISLLK